MGDICRLCLKIITGKNNKVIGNNMKEMLVTLVSEINLDITIDPKVCKNCSDDLFNSYEYKSISLNAITLSQNFVKIEDNMQNVILDEKPSIIIKEEKPQKCSFCKENIEWDKVEDTNIFIKLVLKTCFPEMEKLIPTPTSCDRCLKSLKRLYMFVNNCQDTEDKIKNYSSIKGVTDQSKVNLYDIFKIEENSTVKIENEKECVNGQVVMNEINLKGTNVKLEPKLESESETELMEISEESNFNIKTEEVDIKCEEKGSDYPEVCPNQLKKMLKNPVVNHKTITQNISNTHPTGLKKYKCNTCSFMMKRKGSLPRHILSHQDESKVELFACEQCSYKSRYKSSLLGHLLIHKDPSELNMYKCNKCTFETKRIGALRRHMLCHTKPTEDVLYQCEICPYEIKNKKRFENHLDNHKNPPAARMYNCTLCSFETKYKVTLERHKNTHKDSAQEKKYKCGTCPYETERKRDLQRHVLTHNGTREEIFKFNCELCTFQTKRQDCLKLHMVVHNGPTEVRRFRCEVCTYETVRKQCLREHMKRHMDPSEIIMYKCDQCPYESRHKKVLAVHTLKHKDPSEINMFKCALCAYQAKHKSSINRHMLCHNDAGEVELYQCDVCMYSTKYKHHLKNHVLTHKKNRNNLSMDQLGLTGLSSDKIGESCKYK